MNMPSAEVSLWDLSASRKGLGNSGCRDGMPIWGRHTLNVKSTNPWLKQKREKGENRESPALLCPYSPVYMKYFPFTLELPAAMPVSPQMETPK